MPQTCPGPARVPSHWSCGSSPRGPRVGCKVFGPGCPAPSRSLPIWLCVTGQLTQPLCAVVGNDSAHFTKHSEQTHRRCYSAWCKRNTEWISGSVVDVMDQGQGFGGEPEVALLLGCPSLEAEPWLMSPSGQPGAGESDSFPGTWGLVRRVGRDLPGPEEVCCITGRGAGVRGAGGGGVQGEVSARQAGSRRSEFVP